MSELREDVRAERRADEEGIMERLRSRGALALLQERICSLVNGKTLDFGIDSSFISFFGPLARAMKLDLLAYPIYTALQGVPFRKCE